jgi:uncharacterized membrane protein
MLTSMLTYAEISYEIIDLNGLGDYDFFRAWSINSNGRIVGDAYKINNVYYNRAILFDSTGEGNNIDLGTLGGLSSWAICINDNGKIVGFADSNVPENNQYATIFQTDSTNNVGIISNSGACSNNDSDQIVGFIEDTFGGGPKATLFDTSGAENHIRLGKLAGYDGSIAESINNNGDIVGLSYQGNRFSHQYRATLFDAAGGENNTDLGTLGGLYSWAICINDNSKIVGQADISVDGPFHAVMFDSTGSGNNLDLGTVSGYDYSWARSINNKGQIVGGASEDIMVSYSAVLFDSTGNGNNIDLNNTINPALGWTLKCATCINDKGWIVGWGRNPSEQHRAFLLIPIPAGPADYDQNGKIDLFDFAVFAVAWKSTPADTNWNPNCDISEPKDDIIDYYDLAEFTENWSPCF